MALSYVLITPAHNEEDYMEETIKSVISQTIPPLKWVIVNDGSTDDTEKIVSRYLKEFQWIRLINVPRREDRHFAAKAHAFNKGLESVRDLEFDLVGNIDADISFDPGFFEYLIGKFEEMPELGVAGTHYLEENFHSFIDSYISANHVNGQVQLFRRGCMDELGGYQPIKSGGVDWVAVTTARMNGWKTFSFGGKTYFHHRKMGTAGRNVLKARFHYGKKDYLFGGHPLWQLFRGGYQMLKPPYVIGGALLILGYYWSMATFVKKPISRELVRFNRKEQMDRLKALLVRKKNDSFRHQEV